MKRDILYEEAFLKELSQSFMEDYIVDIQFSNNVDRKTAISYLKALQLELLKYLNDENKKYKCEIILKNLSIFKERISLILNEKSLKENINDNDVKEYCILLFSSFKEYLEKELELLK